MRLDNEWRYQIPPAGIEEPPRPPWDPTRGMGALYNGMIAPLGDLSMRGVAWYQGEANTDQSDLPGPAHAFMADWRGKFGADLPFLIVQLANYGQPPTAPVESGWAEVREAQRLAVANDVHAGLAIAIDIGERYDIHPSNKQEVGPPPGACGATCRVWRAHRAVRARAAQRAQRRNECRRDIRRRRRSLDAYSADEPIGFELCSEMRRLMPLRQGANRRHSVLLDAARSAAATRVRYCWADSPVCTLFDTARLPAGPFQIEVQP